MKETFRSQYGPPEVLRIWEQDKPQPGNNEILVKVHAATVNRTDCAILTGRPFIMRFFTGLFKPVSPTTGTDFAGVVESTGKDVRKFKEGDKIWGFYDNGLASHAEYITVSEQRAIAHIPENISFPQAAASAEGVHYAYNFINKVKLKPGDKVLINGATGAIGSAAVQLAKYYGAEVSATCRGEHEEIVKSLGADHTIDYTKEDFTKRDEKYDFIFDTVGKSTFSRCKPVLKKKGIYISSELGPYSQNPFLALFTPISGGRKVKFPVPLNPQASLDYSKGLLEEGKFKPLIDREYTLEEIADAFRYVISGQKVGNVIIVME